MVVNQKTDRFQSHVATQKFASKKTIRVRNKFEILFGNYFPVLFTNSLRCVTVADATFSLWSYSI